MLPREKAIKYGINFLTNEELIALIIKTGYKDRSVFDLSKDIIRKANGFSNLLSLNYEELIDIKGIKQAKALEFLAILEIAKRLSNVDEVREDDVSSPAKLVEYLRFAVGFSNQEEFFVIFLSNSGKVLKSEVLFKGTKNQSLVGVDEVLRKAILLKACSIVVCHNHPSGVCEPSSADLTLTNNLSRACSYMNIRLLDHIIISKTSFYSFKQSKLL